RVQHQQRGHGAAGNPKRCSHGSITACRDPFHFTPAWLFSRVVGSGSSGGRSFDLAFFSISISETRIAGATAETGTLPDSAPQYPLKTSGLSEVARMLEKLASGVPTMSAPRTSSSGRPSA